MIDTPNVKENNGVMHTPCGHINHFWESARAAIERKMNGYYWEIEVDEAESELETRFGAIIEK